MSEDTLASQLGQDVSSVRTELSHLRSLGMVEQVGHRWALTSAARALLGAQGVDGTQR
jgi:DNA-binding IclR family transcriptional regulator